MVLLLISLQKRLKSRKRVSIVYLQTNLIQSQINELVGRSGDINELDILKKNYMEVQANINTYVQEKAKTLAFRHLGLELCGTMKGNVLLNIFSPGRRQTMPTKQ